MTAPHRLALPLALLLSALPAFASAQTYEFQRSVLGLRVSGAGTGGGSQTDTQPPAPGSVQTSTSLVDFGSVATHTTEKRQVVLTNTGGSGLGLTAAPAVLGDLAFGTDLTTCGDSLAAGQSCLTDVLFSPTVVGAVSGSLRFSTSITGAPADVVLQGTAFNPVSLASTTLPTGKVGQPYSYDFKQLLSVSNETSPDKALAAWSGDGTLPTGLSFNTSTGVLSGTPSVLNPGAAYTVTGTYKNNQGQQVFTLKVGEAALEVVQVSAGVNHTCAVTTAGGLKCWGSDTGGQLGNDTVLANQTTPVDVLGLTSGVASVSAGGDHTCAVTTAGGLKCWGRNFAGQLGDWTNADKLTPVDVSGLSSGVASISAGNNHTCAVLTTGALKCWGYNGYGAVGNNTLSNVAAPVTVAGAASDVASVAAGGYHTCAVTTTGALKCWGYDNKGQLGDDNSLANKPTPVAVQGLSTGVVSVSLGEEHTCAVLTTGALKCWGNDSSGQLGDNTIRANVRVPAQVLGLTEGVASVSTGWLHTCAMTTAGGLKCWGNHVNGQLGIGASSSVFTPVDVLPPGSGVSQVDAGSTHTCAVIKGGAQCWGRDEYGQLGNDPALSTQFSSVNVLP